MSKHPTTFKYVIQRRYFTTNGYRGWSEEREYSNIDEAKLNLIAMREERPGRHYRIVELETIERVLNV